MHNNQLQSENASKQSPLVVRKARKQKSLYLILSVVTGILLLTFSLFNFSEPQSYSFFFQKVLRSPSLISKMMKLQSELFGQQEQLFAIPDVCQISILQYYQQIQDITDVIRSKELSTHCEMTLSLFDKYSSDSKNQQDIHSISIFMEKHNFFNGDDTLCNSYWRSFLQQLQHCLGKKKEEDED